MTRYQSKAEAPRKGEPESHINADHVLRAFWKKHSKKPFTWKYYIAFNEQFIRKQKLRKSNRTEMGHEYDFVAFNNTVVDPEQDYQVLLEHVFIEIDGEKHDKKNQKINDGVAEDFIHDLYPRATFIRLKKSELLGKDANIYMAKELHNVL